MNTIRALAIGAVLLSLAPAARADDIKIGVVMGQTGTFAFVGQPATDAMRLAFDDLQAAHFFGSMKVEAIFEDNRSDKQEAITLVTRLVRRDGVVAVIGPVSSGEAQAVAPVAVELQVPMYTTATTPEVLKAGPWIFKTPENAESYMATLGTYVAGTAKPKACFIVSIRDNDGYIRQKDIFRDVLVKGGVRIAAEESILAADSDFSALSTKVAASKADCIYLGTPPQQGANIVLQALQAGMSPKTLLVGNTGMSNDLYVKAGGQAVEGTIVPAEFVPDGVNDVSRAFIKGYSARFGKAPDNFAAEGYTMMLVVANAIRNAGPNPTRATVRDEIAKTRNLNAVLGNGTYSLDENRIPAYGIAILKLAGGHWVRP